MLVDMVPCAEMVRFFKGGGEATAAAARIARAYTGREVILNHGYRGWPDVWTAGQNDGGVPVALENAIYEFPFNDLPALERLLAEQQGRVAAVFIGVHHVEPQAGYLEQIRALAHEHDALFVMDEVVTGFRLAPGGAQEYFGVTRDMACFAKAMANGMPLSAVAGRAEVMKTTENLRISITYGGEALSLAAAAACMRVIREEKVTEHLWRVGQVLMDGLDAAAEERGIPFRCTGYPPLSMMGFGELSEAENQLTWSYFLQEMANRGVLMRRGGPNFMNYSHRESDVAEIVATADEVFAGLRPLWKSPGLADHVRVKSSYAGTRRSVDPNSGRMGSSA